MSLPRKEKVKEPGFDRACTSTGRIFHAKPKSSYSVCWSSSSSQPLLSRYKTTFVVVVVVFSEKLRAYPEGKTKRSSEMRKRNQRSSENAQLQDRNYAFASVTVGCLTDTKNVLDCQTLIETFSHWQPYGAFLCNQDEPLTHSMRYCSYVSSIISYARQRGKHFFDKKKALIR